MSDTLHMSLEQIARTLTNAFLAMGFSEKDTAYATHALLTADARGVDSHGLARLEMYYGFWKTGVMVNMNAQLKVLRETPVSISFDAQDGLGIIMAEKAMERCVEKAKKSGICVITVKNGGHISMVGNYALKATEEGLIGWCISNTLSAMAPFGSREKVIGNSPWCLAFPPGNKYTDPIMLDMACAEASFGKLQLAARDGRPIPDGWAIDKDGRPTHDPNDVLQRGGSLIPFGGYKGSALAIMLELMASVLSGSPFAPGIGTGTYVLGKEAKREKIGYFFMAMDPAILRPIEDYKNSIDEYAFLIKNSKPAEGVKEVLLPGEPEARKYHRRLMEGVEMNIVVAETSMKILKELKVLPDSASLEDMLKL